MTPFYWMLTAFMAVILAPVIIYSVLDWHSNSKGSPTIKKMYEQMHEADARTIAAQQITIKELRASLKDANKKIKRLENETPR